MDTGEEPKAILFSDVRTLAGLPPIAGGLPRPGALLGVAPANALPRNMAEVATMTSESALSMAATGLPESRYVAEVHRQFSWRQRSPELLSPVVDQGSCGCCWAVAAASILSDRIAIRTKANPLIPFQILMGCVASCTLCGSCGIQLAFDVMKRRGVPGAATADGARSGERKGASASAGREDEKLRSWGLPTGHTSATSTSSVTGGGLLPTGAAAADAVHGADLSRPKDLCERVAELMSPARSRVWKVSSATKRSPSILELQHAILRDGPVVTIMRIYTDFIIGSDPRMGEPFAATEGVYVHSAGKTNYGVRSEHNAALGTHCMVIVGWGQTKSGMRYWEIRNSWSTRWGDEGYCKVAMTAPSLSNSSVGVDLPIITRRGGIEEVSYGNIWALPDLDQDDRGAGKGLYGTPLGSAVAAARAAARPTALPAPAWPVVALATLAVVLSLLALVLCVLYCA